MALKLNETYPGRFNNPNADYPQGSFKNRTTPTAQDGSYFEQQWANDQLAFFSSLLSGAGVTANGLVDKVGASQYYSALLSVIAAQVNVPSYLSTSGVPGSASNLRISTTGTSATVTITANAICVKDNSGKQQVIAPLSVAANGSSTGANGLDTGSISASTHYAVWVIWNPTTSTAAALLSLSGTSPTMPSGYTHKAKVGWIRTDSTANKFPLGLNQYGEWVYPKVAAGSNVTTLPVIASGIAGAATTPTWVQIGLASVLPPDATQVAIVGRVGNSSRLIAAPNNSYGSVNSTTNPPPLILNSASVTGDTGAYAILPLETNSIYWAADNPGGQIAVTGWRILL